MLVMVAAAFAFGGRGFTLTAQAQVVAAARGAHLQHVSAPARISLNCTAHTLTFGPAASAPSRVARRLLPAYRVMFTDSRIPGEVMQVYMLANRRTASLCARGGMYAASHLPGDGMHDFPTAREWPSRRIDAFTVENGSPPGPGGYWTFMTRGRMLALGGARTRAGAAAVEHDFASIAARISR
jgi:hypothetical protein